MMHGSPSPPAGSRVLELDALRGLAAVAVVLFHFTTRYDQLLGHAEPLSWSLPWGHYGVDLFFMLSGYVILMSLERSRGAVHFAWGRLTRLYPSYWVAAAFTFIVVTMIGLPGQEVSLGDALLNVTMIQSLLGASHIDGAYWSLQAELIFYANMLVLHRCGVFKRPVLAVVVWVGIALAVESAIGLADSTIVGLLTKARTLGSLEYIPLFGVGLMLQAERVSRTCRLGGLFICLTAIAATQPVETLLVDLCLAGVFAAATTGWVPWLRWSPLVWLGAISYPLYLIHQNVGYVAIRKLEAAGATPTTAVIAATLLGVLFGSWLHRGVEVPSLATLRRVDLGRWWALRNFDVSPTHGKSR